MAVARQRRAHAAPARRAHAPRKSLLEWRVLAVSLTLFLYSFGYGGITSFTALYADANGVTPKSIYLTTLAIVVLVTRPIAGRLGDRFGYRRVFLPCLVLISAGLACLALGGTRGWMIASAVIFGCGFGTAYPVFVAYVMRGVSPARRGAAFGAILAAFDTGIGTGSTSLGWIIQHYGFRAGVRRRRRAVGAGAAHISWWSIAHESAGRQPDPRARERRTGSGLHRATGQKPNRTPTSSFLGGTADVV